MDQGLARSDLGLGGLCPRIPSQGTRLEELRSVQSWGGGGARGGGGGGRRGRSEVEGRWEEEEKEQEQKMSFDCI